MKREIKNEQVSLKKAMDELYIEGKYKSGNQLAKDLGLTPQSVNQYRNGEAVPRIETLIAMADYFGVSVDYLLGKSDIKSSSADIQAAVKITGLSEEAVKILDFWTDKDQFVESKFGYNWNRRLIRFISYLIENEDNTHLIDSLCNYMRLNKNPNHIDIATMRVDPETGKLPIVATAYGDSDLLMISGEYAQPISGLAVERLALIGLLQDIEHAKNTLWHGAKEDHGQ